MIWVYGLIYVPIMLFVIGFLYETYLSFARLRRTSVDRRGYVSATWEVTHTLLVFGLVMLLMLFTRSIDAIAEVLFVPAFVAALFLGLRAACYVYIFYVRSSQRTRWIDWVFALSHVMAAVFLVISVFKVTWYLVTVQPAANLQFIPVFVPGLVVLLIVSVVPVLTLYRTR